MNKKEYIRRTAAISGMTIIESEKVINAGIEAATEVLSKGEKLQIAGFGTFEVIRREARNGRNPLTGQQIELPATNTPKFRVGKALKEAVNQ